MNELWWNFRTFTRPPEVSFMTLFNILYTLSVRALLSLETRVATVVFNIRI